MTSKELLDKQIGDLNALLTSVKEDWETDIVQNDIIWFAKLVNKTRVLRDKLITERSKL